MKEFSMLYQRKPLTVEAVRNETANWPAIFELLHAKGSAVSSVAHTDAGVATVQMAYGSAVARVGDWFVKDPAGQISTWSDDEFQAMFEPAPTQ
jgi:hypothetical protein